MHGSCRALLAGSADQRRAPAGRPRDVRRLPGLERDQQPAFIRDVRGQRQPASPGDDRFDRSHQREHRLRLRLRAGRDRWQPEPPVELSLLRRRQRRRCAHVGSSARRRRPEAAVEAGGEHAARHPERDHVRLAVGREVGVLMRRRDRQSGQVMIIVAVWLVALIGSAALVLLAGSVEWQKNQLQQLADQAALDSALKIGIGCNAGKATAVITEADNLVATQRTRTGVLNIAAGTCATPYTGTDTFAGGLSETIHYPYQAHQQQVEVILTLALPISFGAEVGKTSTSVVRRAVAQALPESMPAISATTITCATGQVNIGGSVFAQNRIVRNGTCALDAHARLDVPSGTYSDLGNVSVYTDRFICTASGICLASAENDWGRAARPDG